MYGQSKQAPAVNLKDVEQVIKLLDSVEGVINLLKDKKAVEKIRKDLKDKTDKAEACANKEEKTRLENIDLYREIQKATDEKKDAAGKLEAATKAHKEQLAKLSEEKSSHLTNLREFKAAALEKEKELASREQAVESMELSAKKKESEANRLLVEGQALKDEYDRRMKILEGK